MRYPFGPFKIDRRLSLPTFVNLFMARGTDCLKILRISISSISILVVNIKRFLCVYISSCTASLTFFFSKLRIKTSTIFIIRIIFSFISSVRHCLAYLFSNFQTFHWIINFVVPFRYTASRAKVVFGIRSVYNFIVAPWRKINLFFTTIMTNNGYNVHTVMIT